MGLFSKLFKAGAAAGAGVAAVKIDEKVKENNPGGIGDSNGDGVVDAKDYVEEYKKAAKEVYDATADKIKDKAPEVVEKAREKAADIEAKAADAIEGLKG